MISQVISVKRKIPALAIGNKVKDIKGRQKNKPEFHAIKNTCLNIESMHFLFLLYFKYYLIIRYSFSFVIQAFRQAFATGYDHTYFTGVGKSQVFFNLDFIYSFHRAGIIAQIGHTQHKIPGSYAYGFMRYHPGIICSNPVDEVFPSDMIIK